MSPPKSVNGAALQQYSRQAAFAPEMVVVPEELKKHERQLLPAKNKDVFPEPTVE
jgi:hypothetical protein